MKTKVIFRKFNTGEVIALFPSLAGTNDVRTCMSYLHIGQHGSASIDLGRNLKLALPFEYAPLLAELHRIGYDLEVAKRATAKDFRARLEQINRN